MVDKAVDSGQCHGGVRENLTPLTKGLIGGDQKRTSFVASTDELEEDEGLGLILKRPVRG